MKRHPLQHARGLPEVKTAGAIIPDTLYRLDEAKARMGWRDAAFRAAVRVGLRVFRSGKRIYVLGSDLIAFVTKGEVER
ncbi:MAG: hypothetical protein WCQ77_15085 [Planctomycetota bacterium]